MTKPKPASFVEKVAVSRILRLAVIPVVSLVVILTAALGWYLHNNPCPIADVENASTILLTQMRRYDDVYASAANGTRASIDYPVTVMQQVLVNTQEVDVPACMRTAKAELLDYMGDAIRAFKAFQTGEPNATIGNLLDSSYAHVRAFRMELEAVKACVPYCMPWR